MRRRSSRSLFFTFVSCAALGCLNAPKAAPVAATVTPLEARLVAVSAKGLEFLVQVNIENKGAAEVPAAGLAAQVVLDGDKKVGTTSISKPFAVPGHANTTLDVPVPIAWDDTKVFFDLSTAGHDVPFRMDGILALGDKGESQQPFQLKGTVPKEKLASAMEAYTRTVIHY